MSLLQYNRPPIKEALFDLQIRNSHDFNESLFKKFLDRNKTYTAQEPIRNLNVDINAKTQEEEIIAYKCISQDKKQIVQFRKYGFSFSRLEVYDGWNKNYKEALKLWKTYCEVMNPEIITRVAIRFINKFQVAHLFTKSEEYFKTYIQYEKDISPIWNQMSYRLLLPHNNGIKSHTVFDSNASQSHQRVDIIFDIDVFSDNLALSQNNSKLLENIFNQLREVKNKIFESSITNKIRELIK